MTRLARRWPRDPPSGAASGHTRVERHHMTRRQPAASARARGAPAGGGGGAGRGAGPGPGAGAGPEGSGAARRGRGASSPIATRRGGSGRTAGPRPPPGLWETVTQRGGSLQPAASPRTCTPRCPCVIKVLVEQDNLRYNNGFRGASTL